MWKLLDVTLIKFKEENADVVKETKKCTKLWVRTVIYDDKHEQPLRLRPPHSRKKKKKITWRENPQILRDDKVVL